MLPVPVVDVFTPVVTMSAAVAATSVVVVEETLFTATLTLATVLTLTLRAALVLAQVLWVVSVVAVVLAVDSVAEAALVVLAVAAEAVAQEDADKSERSTRRGACYRRDARK